MTEFWDKMAEDIECDLCKQKGGKKDPARTGCSLCGYEGCVLMNRVDNPSAEEEVLEQIRTGTVDETTTDSKLSRHDLKRRLELLYGEFPMVRIEEHLENDGTFVMEAAVTYVATVRIPEDGLSQTSIHAARQKVLEMVKEAMR